MNRLGWAMSMAFLAGSSLGASDRGLLMDPLKVRGDRQGVRLADPGEDIPANYLPSKFRVVVWASDGPEAWRWLTGRFDDAFRPLGLEPMAPSDLGELQSLQGAGRLKDFRLYRCKNHGAMERMGRRLAFVNHKHETRGWIRQVLVGVGPVPDSEFRGTSSRGWQDEVGLRVYIIGRPEGASTGEDLSFDVTPLVQDLASTLEAAAR